MRDKLYDRVIGNSKASYKHPNGIFGNVRFTTQQLRNSRMIHSEPPRKSAQGVSGISGAVLREHTLQMYSKAPIHAVKDTSAGAVEQGMSAKKWGTMLAP